jgi:hypothetical protein
LAAFSASWKLFALNRGSVLLALAWLVSRR